MLAAADPAGRGGEQVKQVGRGEDRGPPDRVAASSRDAVRSGPILRRRRPCARTASRRSVACPLAGAVGWPVAGTATPAGSFSAARTGLR